ncbi:hypothetical protein DF186_18540, partial [Enterococcus hirae]
AGAAVLTVPRERAMFSFISFFYLRDMCGVPSYRCIGYPGYLGEDVVGERGSISGIAGLCSWETERSGLWSDNTL